MRHIISILLENEAGALSRVAGLFSARGFNIESLTVAPTEDPSLSRMTLVTSGSEDVIEQIMKQLNKLIDTVKLVDLSEGPHIERELMLIKVRASGRDREEMKRMLKEVPADVATNLVFWPDGESRTMAGTFVNIADRGYFKV